MRNRFKAKIQGRIRKGKGNSEKEKKITEKNRDAEGILKGKETLRMQKIVIKQKQKRKRTQKR